MWGFCTKMYDYVWIECKSYMPYMPGLQNIMKSDQAVHFNKWICTWLLWTSMMISSDQATPHNSAPYGKLMVRSFGSKGKAVELNKTWQNTMGEQLETTVDGSEIRRENQLIWYISQYQKRVSYIPGGAGFLPSTIRCFTWNLFKMWCLKMQNVFLDDGCWEDVDESWISRFFSCHNGCEMRWVSWTHFTKK